MVRGVQHNIPLLRSVLDRPDFVAGTFSTAFLAQHYPSPADSAPAVLPLTRAQEQELLALAAVLHVLRSTARAGRGDGLLVSLLSLGVSFLRAKESACRAQESNVSAGHDPRATASSSHKYSRPLSQLLW